MRKSTWTSVYCDSESSQSAVVSYFGGLADGYKILEADCLERNDTGEELKIRAIGLGPDGKYREFIRTFGRSFTVASRPPSERRLRETRIVQ